MKPSKTTHALAGVYAAALTPLQADYSPALDQIPGLLAFLAQRGCHGALLLGTTGEGPSFSIKERSSIFQAATVVRQTYPDFRLLAGTGTPSLEETIELTQAAFDLGFDGSVVLPPYYFRKASDAGLAAWFGELLRRAVPSDGRLFGYHIPGVSGVPLSTKLLSDLSQAYPGRFAGIKDSSGDPNLARELGERFGQNLLLLTGNERLFSHALQNGAGGCITAIANLHSPLLRRVWDGYQSGQPDVQAQAELDHYRKIMDNYQPFAPTLKVLLAEYHNFPRWTVRPPLLPLPPGIDDQVIQKMRSV